MYEVKYGKSVTPCTKARLSGISRKESTQKFTADRAAHSSISALRSNDAATATIGIDAASRFCDTIVLSPPHTSHWNRILPDDPDDDFRIVVIPKRFSPANRSSSYWLFHSSSTRRRTVLSDEREMTSHKVSPWHISPHIVCGSHFCFFWFCICFRNIF